MVKSHWSTGKIVVEASSPFQTHSIRDSTVGYDRMQMLSAGGISLAGNTLLFHSPQKLN